MTIRPRRSALYMPGSNARALEKARSLPADVLIFDLEDAVAPEAKADARAAIVATMATGGYGTDTPRVMIRTQVMGNEPLYRQANGRLGGRILA
jgi:citrate lyase subunit beta/citryl-CoA lyase